jgi:hypothetical protein
MFGREARLPVDVCFGVSPDNTSPVSYLKYVTKMKQELQAAYQLAQATAQRMNQSNKERYDQKVRYHSLNAGDRVLIRNLGLKGKQKLADRWSANPYEVESQFSGIPVYRLKPVDGKGPVKVLHRNHILPLGQAVRLRTQADIMPTPSPRALRRRRAKEKRKTAELANSPLVVDAVPKECHSSDSESEFGFYVEDVTDIPPMAEIQIETPVQDVECSESCNSHSSSEVLIAPCQSEISVQHEPGVERVDVTDDVMAVGHDNAMQTPATSGEGTEVQSDVVPPVVRRSCRERKLNTRFTYDTLGEPHTEIVASKRCSVNVAATNAFYFSSGYISSHAWWCNANALCYVCDNIPTLVPISRGPV